jgi:Rrf2 family iron-sulfur cluster assembly transcriptional regulator
MRLTSKGRYAVSAMVDLNKNCEHGPVTLASISERQFISLSYLEQLFRRLREEGLVASVRGPGGGYKLTRPASEIVVSEIITAVNETIRTTLCEDGDRGCHQGSRCDTHQLWHALGRHIYRFLDTITLEDVCVQNIYLDKVVLAPIENYIPSPEPIVMEVTRAAVS